MKPTLVVLAAGLGSRYKGLKQVDTFGPSGENILDYTVFDAIKAGFGKIVFVIRESMKDAFIPTINQKLTGKIDFEFVFQELNVLPYDYTIPDKRIKPWGTGHALWVSESAVFTPFAIVNADDFYGRNALKAMATQLQRMDNSSLSACMVGYELQNTLSEFGYVSRGICEVENGNLQTITERTKISRKQSIVVYEENGNQHSISENVLVSMNLMGFTTSVFGLIKKEFQKFYKEKINDLTSEFYTPTILQRIVEIGNSVLVLKTDSVWFGVTYPEDKPEVQKRLNRLVKKGDYPKNLWSD